MRSGRGYATLLVLAGLAGCGDKAAVTEIPRPVLVVNPGGGAKPQPLRPGGSVQLDTGCLRGHGSGSGGAIRNSVNGLPGMGEPEFMRDVLDVGRLGLEAALPLLQFLQLGGLVLEHFLHVTQAGLAHLMTADFRQKEDGRAGDQHDNHHDERPKLYNRPDFHFLDLAVYSARLTVL